MQVKRGLDASIFRLVTALGLTLCVTATLGAWDQGGVRRGAPQRAGRGWVENADCSVALRADFGGILVKVGANDRMNCQVRLEAYSRSESEALATLKSFDLSVRAADG